MKIPLILFILLLNHWVVVSSQSLERTVIAASGGHMRNASLSLDWTLGEPVIDLRYNSKIVLSQGFQQANSSELGAFYSLKGTVWAGSVVLDGGGVELLAAGASSHFPPVAKVNVVNGVFEFPFLAQSSYYVRALSDDVATYTTTYYAQSALLANAQILPLSGHMGGVDIHLLESNDVPKPTDPIVEDKPVFNIHVFPNPVSDFVLVKRTPNLDETMRIKVYSIEGVLLVDDSVAGDTIELSLESLPSGVYVLNVTMSYFQQNFTIVKK